MLFWLLLPQINTPDEDNYSDDDNDDRDEDGAVVIVMLENDTDHDDTDHDYTNANNDVLPSDRRATMGVQSRVRGRQASLPPAARSPLRCTAPPALTCLPSFL